MKFKNFVLNFNAAVKNQRQQWLLEKRMSRFFIKGKWKVNVFLIPSSLHFQTEKMDDFENVKITIYGAR